MEEEKNALLKQVPKTASGFEKAFKALKKNIKDQYALLKNIPTKTLESYFKKTEV